MKVGALYLRRDSLLICPFSANLDSLLTCRVTWGRKQPPTPVWIQFPPLLRRTLSRGQVASNTLTSTFHSGVRGTGTRANTLPSTLHSGVGGTGTRAPLPPGISAQPLRRQPEKRPLLRQAEFCPASLHPKQGSPTSCTGSTRGPFPLSRRRPCAGPHRSVLMRICLAYLHPLPRSQTPALARPPASARARAVPPRRAQGAGASPREH